ncbi:MAG: hypothetical protein QM777_08285 [Pseudorhodoferax sp.]
MRDLHKAALERAIFVEFAQRWRADIDLASVASGNPNAREPDILAKSSESDQPLAIELVRLTEQDSQMLARQAPRLPPLDAPPARLPPMASAVDASRASSRRPRPGCTTASRPAAWNCWPGPTTSPRPGPRCWPAPRSG